MSSSDENVDILHQRKAIHVNALEVSLRQEQRRLRQENSQLAAQEGRIKGSLSSSWMNSPIPSLLLPLWQNKSLCETTGMKI